jgi:hypothetical protein
VEGRHVSSSRRPLLRRQPAPELNANATHALSRRMPARAIIESAPGVCARHQPRRGRHHQRRARAATKTLHVRPATIQELEWRAPYARSGTVLVDPAHDVLFSFCDDQLYRLVVTIATNRCFLRIASLLCMRTRLSWSLHGSRASAQNRVLNARSEQQPSDPQEKLQHQRDRYADGQDYQREAEHDAHERQQVASY